MVEPSSNYTDIVYNLKAATGEEKPEGYLKAFYTQQILDYQKYIEEMGPMVELVRGQMAQLRGVIEELRAIGGGGGEALMRLEQDLSEAEVKLVDLEHWVKKAHTRIDEKRRLLGEDW